MAPSSQIRLAAVHPAPLSPHAACASAGACPASGPHWHGHFTGVWAAEQAMVEVVGQSGRAVGEEGAGARAKGRVANWCRAWMAWLAGPAVGS